MSAAQTEFDQLTSDKSRRTTHHDARSFLNISDGEDDDEDAHRRNRGRDNNNNNDNDNDADPRVSRDNPSDYFPPTTLTRPRHSIPPTRYAANTGPKGVISDAQNFRESCRQYRRSQHQRPTAAPGARRPPPSHFATTTYTSSADRDPLSTSDAPANHGTRDDDNDEDDDDRNGNGDDADAIPSEDEDFMHHWRRRRLHEMQSSRAGGGGGGGGGGKTQMRERPRRLWGGLATVDGKGYLDAVDGSGPDTVVIVYIYDDYSHVSISVEDCLRELAHQHVAARFVRLHFRDAEMEPAGVPALLAYRAGEKFAGLVPLIQEMPDDADLSAGTLEWLLKRHQILS